MIKYCMHLYKNKKQTNMPETNNLASKLNPPGASPPWIRPKTNNYNTILSELASYSNFHDQFEVTFLITLSITIVASATSIRN